MIDETKLIEKIEARKEYLQRQAARYDKARDVKRMDMCDQAKTESGTEIELFRISEQLAGGKNEKRNHRDSRLLRV